MTQVINGIDSIRSLPYRINSSSLKERKLLFSDLHKVLLEENNSSNETTLGPLIRKICDLLTSTLIRYQDRKSRLLVINFLTSIIKTYPDTCSKALIKSLVNYFKDSRNIQTNFASARICLSAFHWTTLLPGSILSAMDSEMKISLIDLQGFLVFVISGSACKSLSIQTVKLFKQFWTTPYPIEIYADELSKIEVTSSSSIYLFVLWGYIFQSLSSIKRNDLITTYKVIIVDIFLKYITVSKTKLPVDALTLGGSEVLRQINHEEFKSKLLPGLQRSVLRNPEISLELVTKLITNLSLDLSPYASELGKMIGVSLISKEEDLIKIAIVGSQNLAHQCSDSSAIETLLKLYFGILNGSEGKLTVITQRFGALSGIGALSRHSVQSGPSSAALSDQACQQMLTFLKSEIHEGTLIHACSQMQLWCNRITVGPMPTSLVTRVKEIANSKNAQPFVKSAYFACIDAAFNDENINQVYDLLDLLTASAAKAFNASVTQLPLVTEGLHAAVIVIKAFSKDKQLETKYKSTINGLLDLAKLPFLLGKFVNQSNAPAQLMLISFIEQMCLNYEAKVKDTINFLTTPLVHLMVTPNSYEVRKQAIKICRSLLNNLCETDFFPSLMISFKEIFEKFEKPLITNKDETESNVTSTDGLVNIPALINCIHSSSLIAGKLSENQIPKALVAAFTASHVPILFKAEPKLWITLVKKLADPSKVESLLISIADDLCGSIFSEKLNINLQCNCIKTLVCYFPDQFMDRILARIVEILNNPDLTTITVEEYEIFKYPEGELWDKTVIEALKEETQTKNIKRENKLYSYKEQLAELEIRKEIEAKRKRQNPNKEEPLNEKQIAAKKAQLEKESAIRARLKTLYDDLSNAISYLDSLVDGNKMHTAFRVSKVIPSLTNLLQSPLCSEIISQSFISLSDCSFLFNNSPFGLDKRIGYTILRLLKPHHPIDEKWLREDVSNATEQLINFIHEKTCPPQSRDKYDKRLASIAYLKFTAPAFAYCFPLFGYLIRCDEKNPDLIEKCLEIIIEHSKIRFEEPTIDEYDQIDESAFLKNPQYLPRYEALQTLYTFLEDPIPYLEPLIMSAIRSIAEASNGEEGFAKPTKEELLLYLEKLKKELDCIRNVSLDSLILIAKYLRTNKETKVRVALRQRGWVIRFDPNEEIASKAQQLWEMVQVQPSQILCSAIIEDLNEAGPDLRESVSSAMDGLLTLHPNEVKSTVHKLMNYYKERAKPPPPVKDPYNRATPESQVDNYEPRLGAALVLTKIAGHLNDLLVMEMANFLIPLALGDRNVHVQSQMLEVGISIADKHGKRCMTQLLNVLRKYLDKAQDNSQNGIVKRSVVILMGTLARHLETDDAKVKPIVVKLIETLSTPSELVQEAVANCLPPLIPAFKDEAPVIVQKLLQLLLDSDKHGERRGAAHGIAGIVKGLGILSLTQLGINENLTEAITSKKNANHREGALFAFERLCVMLGRLFEPYIIHILPNLLLCFGDASPKVRKATDDTAKAFMTKLSAHGVKLVLPSLLDALEQDSWRTKTGSIELLGAMAFCAPKQLSSCLPSIVPKLMAVLSDSHPKVQQAGEQALKQIGSVIRNPEIQSIVPILLEALQDPANKTQKCLTTMLSTKFVHFIDAPSLALIMPVTQRAFLGRSTETRKMAAQIIGNMYSLTDQKDLSPYLPSIIPGLKQSLLDPVPEVRAVTARALGAMVKGMGEDVLDQLMPWLMATLTSDGSSVDRSGAAQGLAEVMGGLGLEKLEILMPEIITMSERTDIPPHTKDGYIMLFIYLPMVFTQDFIPYIDKIINPVLKALADESEFVRETALKAGQRIVNMYADTAIQLLLPQLEQGLFDDNWRIRYSSVQLLGDLLYKISGVSGKMTTETADEDDNFGTENSYKAINNCLGSERRNRVISGLYMGRCDVSPAVRQAALHVWKVIVSNTPKTLKEIMPTLFLLLLGCLASNSYDKQKIAARTLGDLVKKLGERVLPEIIPILEQGLESDRADQRQGVCIGLSEIMSSTSREMVQAFVDSLVPTVTKALYDPLPEVRQAAAKTFDSLHAAVGARALDEILPPLLHQLSDPNVGEYTLDGLRQVMAIKSRVVLPYLVPQLTVPPVNTRALSLLATVAGDSLSKHLGKILPALLVSLSKSLDTPDEKQELDYCQSVILSVVDDQGTRTIVDSLLESARNESPAVRRAAVRLLSVYCIQTKAAFSSLVPQLIRGLILLFTDSNEQVLLLSWDAFASVIKSLDSKEQIECLAEVRSAVRHAASDLKGANLLPGFCLNKGISPILPIFREAILNGNPEQKEQAADGLSEVIQLTSPDALKSSVVNIAGPLIRILGDRYSWNVKVSVLDTLSLLLGKAGSFLRPFVPQLQQTFLKSLVDSNRVVRLRAANAMSHLIAIHPKCDPVFADINNNFKSLSGGDDQSLRETLLYALRLCIIKAGEKMSKGVRQEITTATINLLDNVNDSVRNAAASCLGTLCKVLSNDELDNVARDHLIEDEPASYWNRRHGQSIALRIALKETPERMLKPEWEEKLVKHLLAQLAADRIPVVCSGVKSCAYVFKYKIPKDEILPQQLVSSFSRCMNHASNEVKQTVANSSIFLTKNISCPFPLTFLKTLVPLLVMGTKEKNSAVRSNSEQALVTVLKLRSGEECAQQLVAAMDRGPKEVLQECISKTLKKVVNQPEPKEEQFDDTLLT